MKTILVATEKPFAKQAVDGIKEIVEKSGNKFKLLENYTEKQQLLDAVADADAINILANHRAWLQQMPKGVILTPHPKELERLEAEKKAKERATEIIPTTKECKEEWVILKLEKHE